MLLTVFLKYVGYGTQSDPNTGLNPSTPGQMEFAHVLKEEMEAIGIQEVELDEYGYVMGVIPSTVERGNAGYRVYRPYGYQPRNEWQACEPPDYRELCGQ